LGFARYQPPEGATVRILLVEDDAALAAGIARALRAENFAVDVADNGEDGGHLGSTELYDAVVLDLGLPNRDGLSVLRDWRAEGQTVPVLILTARDGWSEKVAGFKAGADDYLTKPFRVEEVILRLRALVRRAAGHGSTRIVCGPLTFDAQLGAFELDGLPLKLTAFEWRVLSALILRAEVVIPRADLIERVYEGDADVDSNSIEVIIGRLRRKIGAQLIETVRGRGYRLTAAAVI
jgi:DNA-binding response OmpR family regulator